MSVFQTFVFWTKLVLQNNVYAPKNEACYERENVLKAMQARLNIPGTFFLLDKYVKRILLPTECATPFAQIGRNDERPSEEI